MRSEGLDFSCRGYSISHFGLGSSTAIFVITRYTVCSGVAERLLSLSVLFCAVRGDCRLRNAVSGSRR